MTLKQTLKQMTGRGCSSVGTAWDWHATDTGLIPLCGVRFSPQSQLSVPGSLWCVCRSLYATACMNICAHVKNLSQSLVDYGNAKTPSTHCRLGSATLLQLAFPRESNPNFLWEKSNRDNTVVKKKKKKSIGKQDLATTLTL